MGKCMIDTGDIRSQETRYNLFDSQGRKITEGTITDSGKLELNLTKCAKGIYMIQINGNTVNQTERIIIK